MIALHMYLHCEQKIQLRNHVHASCRQVSMRMPDSKVIGKWYRQQNLHIYSHAVLNFELYSYIISYD